jgi:hypothetical protein
MKSYRIEFDGLEIVVFRDNELVFRSTSRSKVDKFVEQDSLDVAPAGLLQIDRCGQYILAYNFNNDEYVVVKKDRIVFSNRNRVIVDQAWNQCVNNVL